MSQNFSQRVFTGILMLCALPPMLAGCATSMLSFQSQPGGAEVLVRKLGSVEKPESLGETPLQMSSKEFESRLATPGPFELEFRKDGYQSFHVIVTQTANTDLSVSAELPVSSGLDNIDQLNAVVDRVFEAQKLARAGKYEEALSTLKQIQKDAPQIAVTYEIEGGIYYLQKKHREAYDAFRTAAKYNPRSIQAIRMRESLRKPASETPPVATPPAKPPAPPAPTAPTETGKQE